jgi:DNA repair exonuclease SbcCD nuclease subunit
MADLHLGGWRDPELQKINLSAFAKAMDRCRSERVDFIIISGDLFDTSMPSFDVLDLTSKKLTELKKAGIPIYVVSGSHDYSPSGKTILTILENAELITNVAKGDDVGGKLKLRFTVDKSGAKLTGVFGRKGSLEVEYFKNLDRSIENEKGFKVFLFHSGIEEYKPDYLKEIKAMPLSLLPKGFDYYAGGHIHHRMEQDYGKGKVVFPGSLFPCDFQELERFGSGGFYIVDDGNLEFVPIKEADVRVIKLDAENKIAKDVEKGIEEKIESLDLKDAILLIKVSGVLSEGKPVDINFRQLTALAHDKGARVVRRNINSLSSKEFEEIKVSADTIEDLENKIIKEHIGQSGMEGEKALVEGLIRLLDTDKMDGETTAVFEERVIKDAYKVLDEEGRAQTPPA